ncbi:unnamed protein product [Cochlearia groenlandica]
MILLRLGFYTYLTLRAHFTCDNVGDMCNIGSLNCSLAQPMKSIQSNIFWQQNDNGGNEDDMCLIGDENFSTFDDGETETRSTLETNSDSKKQKQLVALRAPGSEIIDTKHEPSNLSVALSEMKKKWKEELGQELETKRKGRLVTSPRDRSLSRHKEKSRIASRGK